MRRLPGAGPLLLCAIVACQPGADSSQRESERARGAIERHNADLARWYADGQMDSVATLFAPEAQLRMPNLEPLVGREAIVEFWAQAAGLGRWTFELRTEAVTAQGRLAVERGTYTLAFEPGPSALPGMSPSTDTGYYLVHWRREGGAWQIVDNLATSRRPLARVCEEQG